MHRTGRHPRTTLTRGAVGVGTALVFLLAAAPTSGAVAEKIPVDMTRRQATVQFTNCQPASHDVKCIGTEVWVDARAGTVGGTSVDQASILVNLFKVVLHPDGTFQNQFPPLASGTSSTVVGGAGTAALTVSQDVPMSDGTVATVAVTLTGIGNVLVYRRITGADMPECPSGLANIYLDGRIQNASADGNAVVHGEPQPPMSFSASAHPFILSETQKGSCHPPL